MTARTRRVWVTAGSTGWARAPYDPDRDPSLPPDTEHLENTDMSTDHTLSPADIADRCRILGCGVTVSGGNYRIAPPADATTEDGSRPSVVHIPADPDFRSKADRTLSVRNLRNNGVDVMAERDWSARPTAEPEPGPEIPKLTVQGPRPSATWTKVPEAVQGPDPEVVAALSATPAELDRSDEIVAALGAELARILEPVSERIDKLAARVDGLESRPVPATVTVSRVGALDESVGSLARRMSEREKQHTALSEGLDTTRRVLTSLVGSMSHLDARLGTLEAASPAAAAPAPDPRIVRAGELAELVAELVNSLPPRVTIRLGSIVSGLDLSDEDHRIIRNQNVLPELVKAGRITASGKGSAMSYGRAETTEPTEGTS